MNHEVITRAHATSANLGVLFDCGAIAIKELYTDIIFTPRQSGITIKIEGEGSDTIPTDHRNLALIAVKEFLRYTGLPLKGFSIEMHNRIPSSGGLGASAASIIASLKAVNTCFNHPITDQEILSLGLKIEGHGDNLLASLAGGFTLFSESSPIRHDIHESLTGVLILPPYEVRTEKARAVLPADYSIKNTVQAIQNASLLTYGMIHHNFSVLSHLLDSDVIHEPYRCLLNSSFQEVRKAAKTYGALGTVISGSGSAVLSLVEKSRQDSLHDSLSSHFNGCQVMKISFTNEGVSVLLTPDNSL